MMLFSGEQHAIGELMFDWDEVGDNRHPTVMRYATFATRFREDSEFRRWFGGIVDALDDGLTQAATERLTRVQHRLVELMDLLDPDHVVYKERSKIADRAGSIDG